jgi:UPF0716 protein FxsA
MLHLKSSSAPDGFVRPSLWETPVPVLLLLAMLALPLVEIGLFILVGGQIGLLPTLLLVVLAAIAGVLVLRSTGRSLVADSRRAFAEGDLPGKAIADAMLVGLAGSLLILPGFLTDAVALLLLVPGLREALYRLFARHVRASTVIVTARTAPDGRDPEPQRTIDLDRDDWRRS